MFSQKKSSGRLSGRISSVIDNKFVYKDGYKLKKEVADIVRKDIKFSSNSFPFVKLIDIKLDTKDAGSKSRNNTNTSNRHLGGVTQRKVESLDPCFSNNAQRFPVNLQDIRSVSNMAKTRSKSKVKDAKASSSQTSNKKHKWKRSNLLDCSLTPITSKHHLFADYTFPTLHPTLTRSRTKLANVEDAHLHCISTLKPNIQPATITLNTDSDHSQQIPLEVGNYKVESECKHISTGKPILRIKRETRQKSSDVECKAIEQTTICGNSIGNPEVLKSVDAHTKIKQKKQKTLCKEPIESKYQITGKTKMLEDDGNLMKKVFRTTINLSVCSKKKRRKSIHNKDDVESKTKLLTPINSEKRECSNVEEHADKPKTGNIEPEVSKSKKKLRRPTIQDLIADSKVNCANVETKRKRISTSKTLDQKIADSFKDVSNEVICSSDSLRKRLRSTKKNDAVQSKLEDVNETKIKIPDTHNSNVLKKQIAAPIKCLKTEVTTKNKRRRMTKDENACETKLDIGDDSIKIKPFNKLTSKTEDKQIATSNNYTKTKTIPEPVSNKYKKTRRQSTQLEKLELQNKGDDTVHELTSKTIDKKIADHNTKIETSDEPINKNKRRNRSQLEELEPNLKNGDKLSISGIVDQQELSVFGNKTESIPILVKKKKRRLLSSQSEDASETELMKVDELDEKSVEKLASDNIEHQIISDVTKTEQNPISVKKNKRRRKSSQLEGNIESELMKEERDLLKILASNNIELQTSDVPTIEPIPALIKRKRRRKSTQLEDSLQSELKKEVKDVDRNVANKLVSNIDNKITSVMNVPKTEPILTSAKRKRRQMSTELEDNLEPELKNEENVADGKPVDKHTFVPKNKNKRQTSQLHADKGESDQVEFKLNSTDIIASKEQKPRNDVDIKSETFSVRSGRSSSHGSTHKEGDAMVKCKKEESVNINNLKEEISMGINNDRKLHKSKTFEEAIEPNLQVANKKTIKTIRKDSKIRVCCGQDNSIFKLNLGEDHEDKQVTTLASIAKERQFNGSTDNSKTKTGSLLHYNENIESQNETINVSKRKDKYLNSMNNGKTRQDQYAANNNVIKNTKNRRSFTRVTVDTRAPEAKISLNNEKIENSQINNILDLECELPTGIKTGSGLGSPTDIIKATSNNNNDGNIKCTTGICKATFRLFKSADNNTITRNKIDDKRENIFNRLGAKRHESISKSELSKSANKNKPNINKVQDTQNKPNSLKCISPSTSEQCGITVQRQLGSFKIPKKTQNSTGSKDGNGQEHPQVNQSSVAECNVQSQDQKNEMTKRLPSIIKSTDVNSDLRSKLDMLRSIQAKRAHDEISLYASTELESDLEKEVTLDDSETYCQLEERTGENEVEEKYLDNTSIDQIVGPPLCTSTPIVPNPIVTNWLHGCKPPTRQMIPILKMMCHNFPNCGKLDCTYLHSFPKHFFEFMSQSTHMQLTKTTWYILKNCNISTMNSVLPVMAHVYAANNDDYALLYLVHQIFKSNNSTIPQKIFFIDQILIALCSMMNAKYSFIKAVQAVLYNQVSNRYYILADILLSCILKRQNSVRLYWPLIKEVLNNKVNGIGVPNINCILEETIAQNYEHLYYDVHRFLLHGNPINMRKVRRQLLEEFMAHHRTFVRYQTPAPARPPSATSFSVVSNASYISYNEISVEDAKIIATTISDKTVASFIDVIKKNSAEDLHCSVVTHCISQLTSEELFIPFHNFLLEVVEYSKVTEDSLKLFNLLNNLIFNSLLHYNIYKLYKEAGKMLTSVCMDDLLQCKWYANNKYKSNMQTTDQKLVFIIKFLSRGRYFDEAYQMITREDFELHNKCNKELYNYKMVIVKEFIDLIFDDEYPDYRNIINYFIENNPTVCHDSGIWRSYNKYLIKLLNLCRSSLILQEFEFIKMHFANVRPFVLRGVLVELWKRTGMLNVYPLYEFCCKRKIYTQQIGLEGHICVWSNTLVEEVTISLEAFILKMLRGSSIPRPLKILIQHSEEKDEEEMIPNCFKNNISNPQLKIIQGLRKANPPIQLKPSPFIVLNYEVVKRSMENMRRIIPISVTSNL